VPHTTCDVFMGEEFEPKAYHEVHDRADEKPTLKLLSSVHHDHAIDYLTEFAIS